MDPDFNNNGYIYVSYIRVDSDPQEDNLQRLSRFTVTDPTTDVLTIDPDSEIVLLKGDEQATEDHLGGEIRYIDGKLYWATGDNVCCSVVDGSNSQDLTNIYGKVLASIRTAQSRPTTRTTTTTGPELRRYLCQGLRNPFRGGVTPDGQLVVGDVGQNTWEEINLVSAGANFGWPYAEGVCPGPGVCQSRTQMGRPTRSMPTNMRGPWVVDYLGSGLRRRRIWRRL